MKVTVDAAAQAHGEPITMQSMDWMQFKVKYGADLCEEDLPAQSFLEEFVERLAD